MRTEGRHEQDAGEDQEVPEAGENVVDKWDLSVEVEHNAYNWEGEPRISAPLSEDRGNEFIHIDLFSGCGGFSTGFESAGFTTRAALDIHPPSLDTLRQNHPRAGTILGDIRRVQSADLQPLLTGCDRLKMVVTAGVPCQGFSLSNRKRHAEDERNYLFKEFIRVVRELKPAAVVLENVSGLVSTKNGKFKRDIAVAIGELGYDVHFALLNAADYGVPQLRKRVFFVGVPRGSRWLFPAAEFGTSSKPYRTVGDAILGDLPELAAGEMATEYTSPPTNDFQALMRSELGSLHNHLAPSHPQKTIDRIGATPPGQAMYASFKQRIRLHPEAPSPTQICGGIRPQFQFGHPTQARGMTIRERARIQSFPDSYDFQGGTTQGRVQTGNAVPPLLAAAIASQIRRLLDGESLVGVEGEAAGNTLF